MSSIQVIIKRVYPPYPTFYWLKMTLFIKNKLDVSNPNSESVYERLTTASLYNGEKKTT